MTVFFGDGWRLIYGRRRMDAAPSPILACDHPHVRVERGLLVHADAFEWLSRLPPNSLHGIVCDPPYGVEEYTDRQLERRGTGGIWRLPPSFDGHVRAPLPRFTALNVKQRAALRVFFVEFARAALPSLRPGAHVLVAGNAFLSQMVFPAIADGGLEFRTEVVRLVQTLRGGDKPKLGEKDYPGVASLPRGGYEPWGLFRKPLPPKMTVKECLKEFGTGGLRHRPDGNPFNDVIPSERTPKRERELANHPSVKPQSLMRQLVRAILPLGEGVLADPFMGSGSTVAAAEAIGYECVGVERHKDFFDLAVRSVPKLAALVADDRQGSITRLLPPGGSPC